MLCWPPWIEARCSPSGLQANASIFPRFNGPLPKVTPLFPLAASTIWISFDGQIPDASFFPSGHQANGFSHTLIPDQLWTSRRFRTSQILSPCVPPKAQWRLSGLQARNSAVVGRGVPLPESRSIISRAPKCLSPRASQRPSGLQNRTGPENGMPWTLELGLIAAVRLPVEASQTQTRPSALADSNRPPSLLQTKPVISAACPASALGTAGPAKSQRRTLPSEKPAASFRPSGFQETRRNDFAELLVRPVVSEPVPGFQWMIFRSRMSRRN